MADQSFFCPFCGAQQIKVDARFCHVCGQALPMRPAPVAAPAATPVAPRRRNWLWLMPLFLGIAAIAALAFAWQRGLLDLGGRGPAAWTPAAISARTAGGTTTPSMTGGGDAATAPAGELPEVTAAPPSNTPPPPATATPRPTATPPPTATPAPTETPTATATPVTPTPVVGKVIFGSDRNGFAHIFTVRGDGQGLRAITRGNEYFWDPVLSDDGALAAYVSKVNGNTEIFVARSDGSNARPISNHPAEDDHPAWFPGNSALAFASRRDGGWDIYQMNADGSNVRRLTWDGGDNRFVAVSPDGGHIAYIALGGTYPTIRLMVMNADGGSPRAVLAYGSAFQRNDIGRFVYRPDWSPDSTRLAFGADDDGTDGTSVLVVNVDNGSVSRLIADGYCPAWNPDGTRIVYKPSGERQVLFVADANTGRRLYQLTGSDYNAWSPDWAR